jgi:hypothetical protein
VVDDGSDVGSGVSGVGVQVVPGSVGGGAGGSVAGGGSAVAGASGVAAAGGGGATASGVSAVVGAGAASTVFSGGGSAPTTSPSGVSTSVTVAVAVACCRVSGGTGIASIIVGSRMSGATPRPMVGVAGGGRTVGG